MLSVMRFNAMYLMHDRPHHTFHTDTAELLRELNSPRLSEGLAYDEQDETPLGGDGDGEEDGDGRPGSWGLDDIECKSFSRHAPLLWLYEQLGDPCARVWRTCVCCQHRVCRACPKQVCCHTSEESLLPGGKTKHALSCPS